MFPSEEGLKFGPALLRYMDDSELQGVGWMWPAYFSNKTVWNLIAELRKASKLDKPAVLATHLTAFYNAQNLAPMVVHRYRCVEVVKEFAKQIEEAIESAQLGNLHAAVVTLTSVVEGLIRDVAAHHNVTTGHGASDLSKAIDTMMTKAVNGAGVVAEIQQMLRGFKRFFDERLYIHTSKFDGEWRLNRHGILHGFYKDYGHAASFGILMSIIDQLTFLMTMRTSGISASAPDDTPESDNLLQYYLRLRMVAATRPKV